MPLLHGWAILRLSQRQVIGRVVAVAVLQARDLAAVEGCQ
jgi:hypothetical protein